MTALPLNFIPGATKPIIQSSPERRRKYEPNHCYSGIPLRFSSQSTENEKAVFSVGLAALALLAPSEHSNCQHTDISQQNRSLKAKSMTFLESDRVATGDQSSPHTQRKEKKILP